MTQAEAILIVENTYRWLDDHECTGDTNTCSADGGECMVCSVRDCPHQEPLHYHHDGCPACSEP